MNRLLALLTSVSDGIEVDWDKEEAASESEAAFIARRPRWNASALRPNPLLNWPRWHFK